MRITLIRHLPTEWNKKSWLQGRRDIDISPPTDEMKSEIVRNKKYLERLSPFDLVLASSLKRTQQTANLYGYNALQEELLNELDFGPFEGVPKKRLIEKYGNEWLRNPRELVLGESLQNLEERIVLFLEKFQKQDNILVFGHGSWIRAMLSYNRYGDINHMNDIPVKNNECITLVVKAASKRT
ncbi:MAG: phosphoglycerate mutase family protein [Bacillota bacterium]|nr:phosphoglycerate mutase family protein [Bacillota bacterium]